MFTSEHQIDEEAAQSLLAEHCKFRARLYAAMASPQLATLVDCEPLVMHAKMINLFEQLSRERNRLGLYTGPEDVSTYANDHIITVERDNQGVGRPTNSVLQTASVFDLLLEASLWQMWLRL